MMTVICAIKVAVLCGFGSVPCLVKADVAGKVVSSNSQSYYVDFSKAAKEKGYINLDKRLVEKDKCVEVVE